MINKQMIMSIFNTTFLLGLAALLSQTTYSQQSNNKSAMENSTQNTVYFVDKFFIPKTSKVEFTKQMNYNRAFIAKLPGYVRGEAFQKTDSEGNVILITIAVWENQDRLNEAKRTIQNEFKRIGFNPVEFYQRLNINMERDIYEGLED